MQSAGENEGKKGNHQEKTSGWYSVLYRPTVRIVTGVLVVLLSFLAAAAGDLRAAERSMKTTAEYIREQCDRYTGIQPVFSALLSGYSMENNGIVVVSDDDKILASNVESLLGRDNDELNILRELKAGTGKKGLIFARQDGKTFSHYWGWMVRARAADVYTFMTGKDIFGNTPVVVLLAFLLYLAIFVILDFIRMQTAQLCREEQMEAQREYANSLQNKNEQLNAAMEQAKRANAAKTSFLSRMSHDIRTPLNGIIGLLEIDAAHPDNRELVNANREKMKLAADHLLSLINDVLQMSKLESGEIVLAREPIDLEKLAMEIFTIVMPKAAEAGVTVETNPAYDSLMVRWVYGSPLHLRQIFLNLYSNCIKYNKVGGSVDTKFRCVERKGNQVVYEWTISDTGIGMSEAFQKEIFEPFAQEKTDARSVYQGTGLGMAIVKGLLDQMGGSILVKSKEGVGSTFTVTIPFQIAETQEETSPEKEREKEETSIAGLHLLLVEDNELNAEIAQTLLEDEGARVSWVEDGKQAVDTFAKRPAGTFDAILMDIMMPVMDGLTATRTIRGLNRPDAGRIPIIAMTANAFAEDEEKSLAAGMNAHLAKPLEMKKVTRAICTFCYQC